MKHSLWRLISSFYILLISGLMVIISAYAWMVISKSPGVSGVNTGINVPKAFYDKVTVPAETLDNLSLQNIIRKPLNDNTTESTSEPHNHEVPEIQLQHPFWKPSYKAIFFYQLMLHA